MQAFSISFSYVFNYVVFILQKCVSYKFCLSNKKSKYLPIESNPSVVNIRQLHQPPATEKHTQHVALLNLMQLQRPRELTANDITHSTTPKWSLILSGPGLRASKGLVFWPLDPLLLPSTQARAVRWELDSTCAQSRENSSVTS